MAVHDPDATPRASRVMNPNWSDDNTSQSSQIAIGKSRRFSLRSISGSLSSLWGKESLPRSHTTTDQDSPSYGCTSSSTGHSSHHADLRPAQKRFPIDGEDKSSTVRSYPSSVSHRPFNRYKTGRTAYDRTLFTEHPDRSRQFAQPQALQRKSRRSHAARVPLHSNPNRGIFRRVLSKVMASNDNLPNGIPHDENLPVESPSRFRTGRPVVPHVASLNSILAPGVVETGGPSNAYNGTLDQHHAPPGRPSQSSDRSAETVATSPHPSMLDLSRYHNVHHWNPLQAPPPSPSERPPSISASERSAIRRGMTSIDGTQIPLLTAIKIESQAFKAREDVPKNYRATAYAIFNITTLKQNALLATEEYQPMANYPGSLLDIEIQTQISGPGIKLGDMGAKRYPMLNTGDCCAIVVRIGIREDSLASRLSTSLRSRNGNHDKSTSAVLIDHFLDVLKMDNNRHNEPVVVTAIIKYRHNFLPETTVLETRSSCTIKTFDDTRIETAFQAARRGKARAQGPESITNSSDDLSLDRPLATSVVRALDPGVDAVNMVTIERVAGQKCPSIPPADALRLIEDYRVAFASATDHPDLASLEDFYSKALSGECVVPGARSLRHRARGVIKKLSPRKATS
ncbi:hypothetical protein LTR10_011668 [Elasticomyces elasticus]|uniref:Uncharacterized protein n=1 Tax=Exophiala sideris TaxID=1016849 RepID=A0ABR0JET6_9EURO|nr:hypothetical protein LTR10_011668 [Elasticomyces elasticus]KAK5031873.1 hypothetical protein LTS07_004494 [Exophiala sideris]KAK5040802.1 hypothetical protein LTR13_003103 [Exophiala sideris]KAK5061862.1 hypothetical protein LTR69_005046 [Exophiala sideris]KAK5184562.1 hypothetical protein LTR44_003237 [Eurotiomycetes sp. CCFEE 6388]